LGPDALAGSLAFFGTMPNKKRIQNLDFSVPIGDSLTGGDSLIGGESLIGLSVRYDLPI
jgi:hypothetical protein